MVLIFGRGKSGRLGLLPGCLLGNFIFYYIFRYGTPANVIKKHKPFAEWFLKSFTEQIINVLLNICEVYRRKTFVSKSVLSQTLEYFSSA